MIRIVVDSEQAKAISERRESVEIVDASGKRLGYLSQPFTEEEISTAKEWLASDQERVPSSVVLERLRALEAAENK
jgi:hypothetical protein